MTIPLHDIDPEKQIEPYVFQAHEGAVCNGKVSDILQLTCNTFSR
jgi:hypothetical protein